MLLNLLLYRTVASTWRGDRTEANMTATDTYTYFFYHLTTPVPSVATLILQALHEDYVEELALLSSILPLSEA